MTREEKFGLAMKIVLGILALGVVITVIVFAATGCSAVDPIPVEEPAAAADLGGGDLAEQSTDTYQGRGGGSLPPGYNQRQCQWDACGGPLPDRQDAVSNPVR